MRTITFDFDDAYPGHDALDRLYELHALRSDFRCTLFAIPALCTEEWCEQLPEWVELAVHGWDHHSVYECSGWSRVDIARCLDSRIVSLYFAEGFKAPGWQISDACYSELLDRGWWVADQHLEDGRRPVGLRTYFYEDGNWHGHIDNCDGAVSNGIEETWDRLVDAVRGAEEFRWCSESVGVDPHADDSRQGAVPC